MYHLTNTLSPLGASCLRPWWCVPPPLTRWRSSPLHPAVNPGTGSWSRDSPPTPILSWTPRRRWIISDILRLDYCHNIVYEGVWDVCTRPPGQWNTSGDLQGRQKNKRVMQWELFFWFFFNSQYFRVSFGLSVVTRSPLKVLLEYKLNNNHVKSLTTEYIHSQQFYCQAQVQVLIPRPKRSHGWTLSAFLGAF